MKNVHLLALLAGCALALPPQAFAQQQGADQRSEQDADQNQDATDPIDDGMGDGLTDDFGDGLDGFDDGLGDGLDDGLGDGLDDDLDLLFEDFDVVVSAGRTARRLGESAVAISVLRSETIESSLVPTLGLLFDYIQGVDALQIDRNRFAVGVNGFHHEYSDRTLSLIDGRNVGSPVFGGADFQRFPITLGEIDRIEVVRGPGGAAWGANAFNGVVNIIRKTPRKDQGLHTSVTANDFGDVYTQLRYGDTHGDTAWRVAVGYDKHESSTDAVNDPVFAGGVDNDTRDFARALRFSVDVQHDLGDETELTFGIGNTHLERGDSSFLGIQPGIDERIDYYSFNSKLSTQLDNSSWSVSWYGSYEDVNRPPLWRYGAFDTTLESQASFEYAEDHEFVVGGSVRISSVDADQPRTTDLLEDKTYDDQWLGIFIGDRRPLSDRWTLETQLRADWYSGTETDWSGRLSAFYDITEDGSQTLRVSAGKAFRAPPLSLRSIQTNRVPLPSPPLPPNTFGVVVNRAAEINNEQVYALETGYRYEPGDGLTLAVDAYWRHYEDLSGVLLSPDPFSAGRVIAQLQTRGDADAWGIEPSITWNSDTSSITAWYSLNHFKYYYDTQPNARAFEPAEHKAALIGRTRLWDSVTAQSALRFTGRTPGDPVGTGSVPAHYRLDLALEAELFDGRGTLSFGVLDLFDDTDLAIDAVGSPGGEFKTPGRQFVFRIGLDF